MGEWADWCKMREHTHLEQDPERFKYFKDEEPAVYPEKVEGVLDMPWYPKADQLKYDLAAAVVKQTMKVYDLSLEAVQLRNTLTKVKEVLASNDTDFYMIQTINRIVNG